MQQLRRWQVMQQMQLLQAVVFQAKSSMMTETSSFPCLLCGHSPLAQTLQRQIMLVQKAYQQQTEAVKQCCYSKIRACILNDLNKAT
jgi:hypothetical protein